MTPLRRVNRQAAPLRPLDLVPDDTTEEERQWVSGLLGVEATYDALDRIWTDGSLTPEQRQLLRVIRDAATAQPSLLGDVIVQKPQLGEQRYQRRVPRFIRGATAQQNTLSNEMPQFLIGQDRHLAAFQRLLKDYESPARVTPAILGLSGNPGHGKDQALDGFTRLIFGPSASVHEVDIGGITKPRELFADGAPLGPEALAEHIGPIRIRGAANLQTNAHQVAQEMLKLITRRISDQPSSKNPYIFDFDEPPTQSALEFMKGALGRVGGGLLSAYAAFENLDPQAMEKYARIALHSLLKQQPDLRDLTVELDAETSRVLWEVLATPDAPLDQLENRLHRFILTHFDTQTSLVRRGGVVRVTLSSRLDQGRTESLIGRLVSPEADVIEGEELFEVYETGQKLDPQQRRQIIEALKGLIQDLEEALDSLETDDWFREELTAACAAGSKLVEVSAEREKLYSLNLGEPDAFAACCFRLRARAEAWLEGQLRDEPPLPNVEEHPDRTRVAQYLASAMNSVQPLIESVTTGQVTERIRIPRMSAEPSTVPKHLLRLQEVHRAAYPIPRVEISRERSGDWVVGAENRLPDADQEGPLAVAAVVQLNFFPEGSAVALSFRGDCGEWRIEESEIAAMTEADKGSSVTIAFQGTGWIGTFQLPGSEELVDSDDESLQESWRFEPSYVDRRLLSPEAAASVVETINERG